MRLYFLKWYVILLALCDFCKIVWNYYGNRKFRYADITLRKSYLFTNPYRVSRQFLTLQGADIIHQYGETPLAIMEEVAALCKIGRDDVFYDLGCGRGQFCIWLAAIFGCKTVGIEQIPLFVRKAEDAAELLPNATFIQGDYRKIDLSSATVIYYYDLFSVNLELKIPEQTKVVTVSEPPKGFTVMKKKRVRFPWGETDLFISCKT